MFLAFRKWKGGDLFESNVRDKLSQEDWFLNDYYDVTEINFEKDSRQLVYCKNIKGLVETVIMEGKLSKNYILKVGIDVGGGFLKVCLSIIEKVTGYKVKKKHKIQSGRCK